MSDTAFPREPISEARGLDLPLHAEVQGEVGPPVVLVHGLGANSSTWSRWLPLLTPTHRMVMVDMKGAGSSPKPRGADYSPPEQAGLLHRLILQRDLSEVTLVGHSLGGGVSLLVALRLLAESPVRLKRLVLIAPAAYPQPLPFYLALAGRPVIGALALRLIPKSYLMRKALEAAYHNGTLVTSSQVHAYCEPLRRPSGVYALREMIRQVVPHDLDSTIARYRELAIPTLLMWGRQDRIVPLASGKRLLEDLPMAQLQVLEECGHVPHEERPQASFQILRDFLAT